MYVLVIFQGGCPDPLSPSGSAHGQCHHNGTIFITVPLLTIIFRLDLSGLMTDEVFQMMHWYCAHLTPSRNTALGSGCFCNSAFFLPNIHYVNAVSRTISVSKKDGKDQESIQSSTTHDPGHQWESNKLTVRHHRRELRIQDNLQIYYSSASATVLSKGTEPR